MTDRPSPSTVTDEGLVERAKLAIQGETMHGLAEQTLCNMAQAALAASGHTALLKDNADLKHDMERQMAIANSECNRVQALLSEVEVLRETLGEAKSLLCCSRANVDSTMRPLYGNEEQDALLDKIDAALSRPLDERSQSAPTESS